MSSLQLLFDVFEKKPLVLPKNLSDNKDVADRFGFEITDIKEKIHTRARNHFSDSTPPYWKLRDFERELAEDHFERVVTVPQILVIQTIRALRDCLRDDFCSREKAIIEKEIGTDFDTVDDWFCEQVKTGA